MKILIISTNYTPELTGIGKFSGEMAEWLDNAGNEIRVICSPPYYPNWKVDNNYSSWRYKTEINRNTTIFRCPIWVPKKASGSKRIIHLLSFALSSFPIVLRQYFWKPQLVVCIEPPIFNSIGAILISKMCSSKSILHIQDFEIDAAFDLGIIKANWLKKIIFAIEKYLLRKFTRVSTISKSMIDMLENKGIDESKRLFFPNWVDIKLIYPMNMSTYRSTLNIPSNKKVVMYSGNMGEKQGLEIVISAANSLPDIQFIMCGTGTALQRLKESAKKVNNIIWLPLQPLEKLNDFLNLADIHLLPQQADAADLVMPSKLTGMLSTGIPIIATAKKGTEVYSILQNCGLLVNPNDVDSFINAILYLVENSNQRELLGKNARKYAESFLNYNSIMKQFLLDAKSIVHN